MFHSITAIIAGLRRLIERREGVVALIFALCAIPIFIAAGMAIDIGRAYAVKVRLGAALDAAALAVGSEGSQTPAQLTTDLQNYFTANYPATALGGGSVSVTPVPANADLTAATVNYQAQATVPMTLMRLVGVDSITVTATAQTKKTTGLEIAVVLDNTGSMLCGPNDGAPSYSNSTCSAGVVASDTTCTNSSNTSRICTLINASTQFINTLTSAINASQQLYISIVPYVTTVNVGNALCTSGNSCSHITTDTSSGDFTDQRGNILPTIPITGNTTTTSSTISSISPNTSAIYAGMQIAGTGIPAGATVSSVASSTSITINPTPPTITKTGNVLAIGPSPVLATVVQLFPSTVTGNWTNASKTITSISPNTTGIVVGMGITGTGIPAGATVASIVSSTSITISANATSSQTGKTLTINPGNTTSGSTTISGIGYTTGLVAGMSISGTGIPAGATIASIAGSTSITISASATSTNTATALTIKNLGGNTTSGGGTVTNITSSTPTVGMVISGNGIPANTAIQSFSGTFASGTGQVTLTKNATATNNTALAFFSRIHYDTTNTNTTSNWMGCVIEPTSSGENSSVSGVINYPTANPDITEPTNSLNWYPFWWPTDSVTNTWTSATVKAQSTATETQGLVITDWLAEDGPNQGCPVPMLPLTDVTTASGKTQVLNTISSMWPRDAGGTQVHIGMIWGWRALSSNGPFTPNNGHPLSYSTASTTGWKKAIVLMTDGTEEWPATDNMTGLGQIADGKIGTSSSTSTAQTNLNTRLVNVCSNLAANGNFIIYTIGLGSDGASNTALQNCATTSNGGFFEAATPSNLQKVFNDIAKSLIALRLSQ